MKPESNICPVESTKHIACTVTDKYMTYSTVKQVHFSYIFGLLNNYWFRTTENYLKSRRRQKLPLSTIPVPFQHFNIINSPVLSLIQCQLKGWYFVLVRQDNSHLNSLSLAQRWLAIIVWRRNIKGGQMLAGFPLHSMLRVATLPHSFWPDSIR
jgi:hypothetical protein